MQNNWTRKLAYAGFTLAFLNIIAAWVFIFTQASPNYNYADKNYKHTSPSSEKSSRGLSSEIEKSQKPIADLNDEDNYIVNISRAIEPFIPAIMSIASQDTRKDFVKYSIAFVLICLGFSFFMIGIESATHISANLGENPWIILKVTSPGTICLIFGSLIAMSPFIENSTESLSDYSSNNSSAERVAEARARLIEAQADALSYDDAEDELKRARARLTEAKADEIENQSPSVAEANAELLRAKALLIEAQADEINNK